MATKQKTTTISTIEDLLKMGRITRFTSEAEKVPAISTGSLMLDKAVGIGGLPLGRIVEIYGSESAGKSTLCQHVIANAQRTGYKCLYIDMEHGLDPEYMQRIGVDLEKVYIAQPNTGEDALELVGAFILGGGKVVVVDSVSALIPRAELEGEVGDAHVGLQARLMSQAMRKLGGLIKTNNALVIFTNQIRMKIGVMYGCLHYDTLVNLADGRSLPIGKIVDERIAGDVYCLNMDTGLIETQPITDWHDNGKVEGSESFIHIQTNSINGGGRFGFTCTPDHLVLTDKGWKRASDLTYDSKLVSKYLHTINNTYGDFLRGVLVGDSHLALRSRGTASLKLQDNGNYEYITWKLDKLQPKMSFTERETKRGYVYGSDYTYELARIKQELNRRNPLYLLNHWTPLGMAVWIMDDAHLDLNDYHSRYILSVKRLKGHDRELTAIQNKLLELGFQCNYNKHNGSFYFTADATNKIAKLICTYVPGCMQYKLPEQHRNQYKEFELSNEEVYRTELVDITEIRYASPRQMRSKRKFDISVANNQNYMVGGCRNGVVVHNSPETTSGGNALKFYASVRIDCRIAERNPDGSVKIRATVKKNKVGPPAQKAEYVITNNGIDLGRDLIQMGVNLGFITKKGGWLEWNGVKENGDANFLAKIDIEELNTLVRKELGL